MPRRNSPILLASLLLLAPASCAAPVTPPAAPDPAPAPPPPPSAAVAKPAEPADSAPPAAPTPPAANAALSLPPPITEALPPLTRAFMPVSMPGVRGWLTSISGRSPQDIWLLTGEEYVTKNMGMATKKGKVVHHDGRRVVKQYEPSCYGAQFSAIQVAKDGVILSGSNPFVRAPPVETALLSAKGEWECWNAFATVRAAPGDYAWTLNCGSPQGHYCYFQAARGRRAALPRHHASFGKEGESTPLQVATWQLRGDDDGWMVAADENERPWLLRYNGVTWVRQTALDGLDVSSLWVSEEGQVWLMAVRERQSSVVLRFDGRALHALPVPESFTPTGMIGAGPRETWFFGGGRKIYQYDGQRIHQGEASFDVADAWAAPNGQVWIVGGVGNPEGDTGKPMAARTAPFPEGR